MVVDGFNYPVGPRNPGSVTEELFDNDGWYNAQDVGDGNNEILKSGETVYHTGEDWNSDKGGNRDVGEPIYAIGHGEVIGIEAKTTRDGKSSVGSVIILKHLLADGGNIFSVYLHVDPVCGLEIGDQVARGQIIGSISDISVFPPHLHFEIRTTQVEKKSPQVKDGEFDLYRGDVSNTGYYKSVEKIEEQGFIDPSDFIDNNRPAEDTPPTLDIYLIVDTSNSYIDDLVTFKAVAPVVISVIKAFNSNARFGLGTFVDYPISPFGSAETGDKAYEQLTDLTFDRDRILEKIKSLSVKFGDDIPESQLTAMFQAATGDGQDLSKLGYPGASISACQQANFSNSNGAIKLIVPWTDAPFHQPGDPGDIPYPGPSFQENVDAILALDPPKVIGISSGEDAVADLEEMAAATDALAPAGGVDCDDDGSIDIAEGEPLVCSISTSGVGIGEAIISLVDVASELPTVKTCDVNNDGAIDKNDISAITSRRNQPATGSSDPADADGDGTITVTDARACVLECDLPRCATPVVR
jgi:peptidase M23-like protein/integrin beta-like protein/dockerin type I repeat protein